MACKTCYGSGKCKPCGGTGYVSTGAWTNKEACPYCKKSKTCQDCRGRG